MLVTALSATLAIAAARANAEPLPDSELVLPFVQQNCIDCHSEGYAESGVMLDHVVGVGQVLGDRHTWGRVLKQVRAGAMPPNGCEEVSDEDRAAFVGQLESLLTYVDPTKPVDPGRVTARRLNKDEYDNTIRDLFGLDLGLANSFPDDDAGYGFDNNGDVLTVSPLHLEKYLAAAEELTARLFISSSRGFHDWIPWEHLQVDGQPKEEKRGLLITPGATVSTTIVATSPGVYRIKCVLLKRDLPEGKSSAAVRLSCGGQELGVYTISEDADGERQLVGDQITLQAGRHPILVEYAVPKLRESSTQSAADLEPLKLNGMELHRERDPSPDAWPPAARALLFDRPAEGDSPRGAVERIVRSVLPRCWRRAVSEDEVQSYAGYAVERIEGGATFEQAVATMVQAALVSPNFLFRVDLAPPQPAGQEGEQETAQVDSASLASRLSYFLWRSTPDDELLDAAGAAKLDSEADLVSQINRMLDDPRSSRFIESFFGQWLGLRKLESLPIDRKVFRSVDSKLKEDMQTETLMLAESIVREDQSVLKLITANYTFVNRSLAKLYGIEGVRGDSFQRVPLTGQPRRGLLTHASVLTLTSYPNRTSPPRRGAWVLENLLGDEPPAPPADVPDLAETQANSPDLPLRDQLELHRTDATCASCHRVMDAVGFGLENYNAIGQWRDKDKGQPIDAAGDLPTGESFSNALELISILESRDEAFAECVTRKMLTFALGRGLEYYDRIAVEGIVESIKADNYQFSQLVREVVLSRPFRQRRIESPAAPVNRKEPS
ncbi:hypothetical protein Pla123a_23610 [Posidoniimonas polymericola]|uniref:Planctomycete cytochrome C n=1 Tax=Posidoniimonas polymericola TaxID=2528002 RepID=A0A5C5YPV2_9BACT|nr:DUF1592 domain-containing protein [Posidoniimonas polymericola]TWT76936.1 hypothetical protein Pla123a_23610 [Posidoniimonas polymericola]